MPAIDYNTQFFLLWSNCQTIYDVEIRRKPKLLVNYLQAPQMVWPYASSRQAEDAFETLRENGVITKRHIDTCPAVGGCGLQLVDTFQKKNTWVKHLDCFRNFTSFCGAVYRVAQVKGAGANNITMCVHVSHINARQSLLLVRELSETLLIGISRWVGSAGGE